MKKADAEALVSLLEGSGVLEGLTGGVRSHKAQYVRWLLGKVVEKNPNARIRGKDKLIHYNPPYRPTFDPYKLKDVSQSERFGEVPRSRFINRMIDTLEERQPVFTDIDLETARPLKKVVTKVKGNLPPKKVAKPAEPSARFVPGQKVDSLDALILFLHKQKPGMTERDIVKKIKDEYGLNTSQPTVHRRIRAFKDGKIDEEGKPIKK